jgi:hypothetical protein
MVPDTECDEDVQEPTLLPNLHSLTLNTYDDSSDAGLFLDPFALPALTVLKLIIPGDGFLQTSSFIETFGSQLERIEMKGFAPSNVDEVLNLVPSLPELLLDFPEEVDLRELMYVFVELSLVPDLQMLQVPLWCAVHFIDLIEQEHLPSVRRLIIHDYLALYSTSEFMESLHQLRAQGIDVQLIPLE